MKWPVGLLLFCACGPTTPDEPLPSVERELVIRTSAIVSNACAEPEPEAPPFRDEDATCDRARERATEQCIDHPTEMVCAASRFQTFWDPHAHACRLSPDGGYAGAGCMSGGGGGLSIYATPESVGLACMSGTFWSGCSCDCMGTWDSLQRRCKP